MEVLCSLLTVVAQQPIRCQSHGPMSPRSISLASSGTGNCAVVPETVSLISFASPRTRPRPRCRSLSPPTQHHRHAVRRPSFIDVQHTHLTHVHSYRQRSLTAILYNRSRGETPIKPTVSTPPTLHQYRTESIIRRPVQLYTVRPSRNARK